MKKKGGKKKSGKERGKKRILFEIWLAGLPIRPHARPGGCKVWKEKKKKRERKGAYLSSWLAGFVDGKSVERKRKIRLTSNISRNGLQK